MYLFVILAILITGTAWAVPALKIVSAPQKITLGDRFTFQVKVEWSNSEGPYEVQAESPLFEKLELIRQGQSEETTAAGIRVLITLELFAKEAGEGRILPFRVMYRTPDQEIWKGFPVAGQKILIVQSFPWKPVLVIFFTLVASLITVFGLVALKKKAARRKLAAPPADPKQRVYAHAEETILTYKGETQKETIEHWASEIKNVVTEFYGISGKTTTDQEVLALLKTRSLPASEFSELERIFREIEQLKFTAQTLPIREMGTLQKTLLQYVRSKIIIENPLD